MKCHPVDSHVSVYAMGTLVTTSVKRDTGCKDLPSCIATQLVPGKAPHPTVHVCLHSPELLSFQLKFSEGKLDNKSICYIAV